MKQQAETPDRAARRHGAFTLLEVMAAVAILGIWYVIIAEGSVQGLRAEGTNRRILEASLIADSRLADIEAGLLDGSAPAPSESSSEQDGFEVSVKVVKFSKGAGRPGKRDEEESRSGLAGLGPLISEEIPGAANHLRQVYVDVSWQEGNQRRAVRRITFAFDAQKAAESFWGDDANALPEADGDEP